MLNQHITTGEPNGKSSGPRYLSPEQAAQFLGVHKNTIWKLIREGKLPARRIGPRIVRIAPADVEALLTDYVGGEFGRWSK